MFVHAVTEFLERYGVESILITSKKVSFKITPK